MPWNSEPNGIRSFKKCTPAFTTLKVHDPSLGKNDLSLAEVGSDDRHKSVTASTLLR